MDFSKKDDRRIWTIIQSEKNPQKTSMDIVSVEKYLIR